MVGGHPPSSAWICTPNILALHTTCKPIINTEHASQTSYKWQPYMPYTMDTLNQMSANVYHYIGNVGVLNITVIIGKFKSQMRLFAIYIELMALGKA